MCYGFQLLARIFVEVATIKFSISVWFIKCVFINISLIILIRLTLIWDLEIMNKFWIEFILKQRIHQY